MTDQSKTGALILSGGKSRRMGRDKTLIEIEGETFLERAVRFWENVPGLSRIYLSIGSEEHLEKVAADPRIKALLDTGRILPVMDRFSGCGPMAGIHAAFLSGDEDYLYVSAIDSLDITLETLPKPCTWEADAWVYAYQDLVEPLFALYSRRCLEPARQLLTEGRYSLRALLDVVRTEYLPIRDEQLFIFNNYNTPEDLAKLVKEPS